MITEANTERGQLVDMAADHAAAFWYKLKYPQAYRSMRYVQNHRVLVIIMDGDEAEPQVSLYGEELERRLKMAAQESDYLQDERERDFYET